MLDAKLDRVHTTCMDAPQFKPRDLPATNPEAHHIGITWYDDVIYYSVTDCGEQAAMGTASSVFELWKHLGHLVDWPAAIPELRKLNEEILASCPPEVAAALKGLAA